MKKVVKKIYQTWKRENGMALIVALGVVSIMLIVGVLILSKVKNTDATVSHDRLQTTAVNVAEAGVDNAIATTIANFQSYFPNDIVPTGPGDGMTIYSSPQQVTEKNGTVVGTYQVWARQDPNIAGNVLLTATGTVNQKGTPFTKTVRVSIQYTTGAFDYAYLGGTQTNNNTTTQLETNVGGDDNSVGGNIKFTGKFNVNGNLLIQGVVSGYDDDLEGARGTVAFETRQGYTDPVTYTGTYTEGNAPSGTQPQQASTYVQFPTVNFSKFQSQTNGGGFADNKVITINMPASGAPSGWTRSYNTIYIDANTFQQTYGGYDVVRLTAAVSGLTVKINSNCGGYIITPTIVMTKDPVSGNTIKELDFVGPGLSLIPTDGVALLSSGGVVSMQTDVTVGSQTAGALVYLSGQDATSSFNVTGDYIMWGSLVVNGATNFNAVGLGEQDDEDDNPGYHNHYCGGGDADSYSHYTNISVSYGSEYLNNSNLPAGWWSYTGGTNDVTALKYNYQQG